MSKKWGFLRETEAKAKDAGFDKDTGLHRTGLDEYLLILTIGYTTKRWVR